MNQNSATPFALSTGWDERSAQLDMKGWAVLPNLISRDACAAMVGLYNDPKHFRSQVMMARHGFGRGEYRYFAYPLPSPVAALRTDLDRSLAPIANGWHQRMKIETPFPPEHAAFIERRYRVGQSRPTPLLLQYGEGDYNCLHQDLYGEHVFPLQVALLLAQPGDNFKGGEFVLTEQRPRMQSRASVIPLNQGDGVIFAVSHRPMRGTRGDYRVTMCHDVSTVLAGHRHTLGIIFHDAT
jgi:hypothetical protein